MNEDIKKIFNKKLGKKKVGFIPKIHPIMISQGESLKITGYRENLSDESERSNDHPNSYN